MVLYADIALLDAAKSPLAVDYTAIAQSIYNILATRIGTRIFNPEFGSRIEDYLFEPCDETTALKIYIDIMDSVSRWEPRVAVDNALTKVLAFPEEHKFEITVAFRIIGLSNQLFSLPLTLTPKG